MAALFNRYDLDRSKYLSIEDFGRMLFKLDGDPHFGLGEAMIFDMFGLLRPVDLVIFRLISVVEFHEIHSTSWFPCKFQVG